MEKQLHSAGSTSSARIAVISGLFLSLLLLQCSDPFQASTIDGNSAKAMTSDLIQIRLKMPDLVVSNLTVTKYSAKSIVYKYEIKNVGNYPANLDGPTSSEYDNVGIQAYLSADTIYANTGDTPAGGSILGLSPLGMLAPGATFTGSFSAGAAVDPLTRPYLVLKVDTGNSVIESNEANNTNAALIPLPDLVVDSLTVTSWSSTSVAYQYVIKNVGNYSANLDGPTSSEFDNVGIQAYLSADTIYANAGDTPAGGSILGLSPLGMLAPGATFTGSFSSGAAVDPLVRPYLVLKVDTGNSVIESNEANNTNAALIPMPDLVVDSLAVTSWTSTSVAYQYVIKNVGNYPANLDGPTSSELDNVGIQAYLSADTIYANAGDTPAGGSILGLSPLGMLAPGATFTGSFSSGAAVDPLTRPYLVLKVDTGNSVIESNEANNTNAALIPMPDLVVDSLAVTSWTSTSINYQYVIKNVGNYPANLDGPTSSEFDNVGIQAYLSADTIYANAGDTPAGGSILGLSPLGMLAPGATFTGSFSAGAAVDPLVRPYLVLKVDTGNSVVESNEANNTNAAPIIP